MYPNTAMFFIGFFWGTSALRTENKKEFKQLAILVLVCLALQTVTDTLVRNSQKREDKTLEIIKQNIFTALLAATISICVIGFQLALAIFAFIYFSLPAEQLADLEAPRFQQNV